MTQESFIKLPLKKRLQWVYCEAEFVTSIRYYAHKVILYKLQDFFVEVFYRNATDRIELVTVLDHKSTRMKFYTDQITLPIDLFG